MLVVVDTLRADHLTTYGWPVPTSPNLDATLARQGVVVERAYSQAPWTIPSMVGLMTGRWPGEVMGRSIADYGIPAETPTLPVALRDMGYETAAFVANPTLDPKLGFARGFTHYHRPEGRPQPQWAHADHLTRMARQWLRARRAEVPFFLYVHYVEPHDPYDSPELVGGRSPYFPGYRGRLRRLAAGLLLGRSISPTVDDIRHRAALYDSEIHGSTAGWARCLRLRRGDARAHHLFVFTADHAMSSSPGGWKQAHPLRGAAGVPLVFRWTADCRREPRPGPVRLSTSRRRCSRRLGRRRWRPGKATHLCRAARRSG